MAEEKERLQVNADFTEHPDLYKVLTRMVEDDDTDRSKFVRKLAREEAIRRGLLPAQIPESKEKKRSAVAEPVAV